MALNKWPLCADVPLSNHSFIPSSISRYTVKFALELFTGTFYYTFCADGLLLANILRDAMDDSALGKILTSFLDISSNNVFWK